MKTKAMVFSFLAVTSLCARDEYSDHSKQNAEADIFRKMVCEFCFGGNFSSNISQTVINKSKNFAQLNLEDEDQPQYSEADTLRKMVCEFCFNTNFSSNLGYDAVVNKCENSAQYYLEKADSTRKIANEYLIKAENCTQFITNLDFKEQFGTLITSAISSLIVKDFKQKLLVVGLALIGDQAKQYGVGIYETYSDLCYNLVMATSNLEKSNYYYKLALGAPLYTEKICEKVCKYGSFIETTVHYLIILDMYTTFQFEVSGIKLSNELYDIREEILSEFVKHGAIITRHSDKVTRFKKNLPEIMKNAPALKDKISNEFNRILIEIIILLEYVEDVLKLPPRSNIL